jgi:F-type H+-transporting ATPase subunit gamma
MGDQPLLAGRPSEGGVDGVRRVGFVVISADRGLAGGYNSGVIRLAELALKAEVAKGRDYSLILTGRKANDYFKFRRYKIDASLTGFSQQPTYEDARAVAAEVLTRFEAGELDQVELVYTQFLSLANQKPLMRRLVPLESLVDEIAAATEAGPKADYEFEPDPGEILATLVPRYIESRIFAAMLDAAASEHAARQRAMKSATDNADELIKVLERRMNRARQDAITTEIIEIASGAEALAAAASGSVDLLRDRIEKPELFESATRHQGPRRIEEKR